MTARSKNRERRWASRHGTAKYMGGVSVRTVDNLLARGQLTAHRIPGCRLIFYDLNEVDDRLEAGVISRGVDA
jgi:hypothetical protein